MRITLAAVLSLVALAGCQSSHREKDETPATNLTTGVVQREIRKGMSGAEVAAVLGQPNIVTTDENGLEAWVYERYARDVQVKQSGYFLIFAFGSKEAAKGSTRTLTVIIKFDAQKKVRDFAYHATTF